ncbi:GGDEF domain-containing protein [Roseomonas sp. 18066]|uniref:GGDEF domain-containing protein n=1 Tax=Roseomonas sp. 18066 TaxID=2681412 RepID=UPI001357D0BF|nr:GGDEF domain-containing protein [Roseomonas sp. 18066]
MIEGAGCHRLLARQLRRARRTGGDYDIPLLLASVSAAYEEADRERRRIDRVAQLMCEEMEDLNERFRHQSLHDALTDLPNRLLFREKLTEATLRARGGNGFALLAIDLDRFKLVNDTLGHAQGDALLVQVSARMRAQLRGSDTLARLGGDEFGLLLEPLATPEDAAQVAQRLVESVAQPFDLAGNFASVGASIGLALSSRQEGPQPEGIDALMARADAALYQAKAHGRNGWCFAPSPLARGTLPGRG